MYYPNQKQVTIIREEVKNSKATAQPYLIAYQQNLIDAMSNLSASTFKVYLCLLFNKNNYTIEFSPEYISKIACVCKDSARRAFIQLEQQGYIKKVSEHGYIFRENKYLPFEETKRGEWDG